jgi:hypothetical protein
MYEQILYVVGEPPFEPRPPKDIGWGASDGLCRVESDWVYSVGTGEDVVEQQLVAVDEFFAPGGAADRLGLRRALESAQYGVVLQPGLAIRLDRTPGRAGDLPDPFVHESAG